MGDVGDASWEEIDVEPAGSGGRNYGWPITDGSHCHTPAADCDPEHVTTPPVLDYGHDQGCGVTG